VTYLDTGCFVKLYYPEPDSAKGIAQIQGKALCFTALHDLEFVNALELKVFFKSATAAQVTAARQAIEVDMNAGVLIRRDIELKDIFHEAVKLDESHTGSIGCRSLDVLHCAAAKLLAANEFISTDARQKRLAAGIGLNVVAI
jgi:hypothetical protein